MLARRWLRAFGARDAFRTPRRCRARASAPGPVLASVLVMIGAAAAAGTAGAPAPVPAPVAQGYLRGPDGEVRYIRAAEGASLEPVALGFTVNDLAVLDGGARLLLLQAGLPAGPKRRGGSGIVSIVGVAGGAPHPGSRHDIPIGGVGMRVVVDRGEQHAYVLTSSNPGVAAPPPTLAIEAVDLSTGGEIASTGLDHLPEALVLQPDDRRLYFAAPDRIETYTVRPLAASWRYRSPGDNRSLAFRPGTGTLFVARARQIALFDPAVIAERNRASSRAAADDATAIIPMSFEPVGLLFSEDGRLAVAWGASRQLALIDVPRLELLSEVAIPKSVEEAASIRPVIFQPEALRVACFPGGAVAPVRFTIPPPSEPAAPPPIASAGTATAPAQSLPPAPALSQPTIAAPPPPPAAAPIAPAARAAILPPAAATVHATEASPAGLAPATPEPAPPSAPVTSADVPPAPLVNPSPAPGGRLSGRLTGRVDLVAAVVLYGPGSIAQERARATPLDGTWSAALPAPGIYRIVPLGSGSRPLRAKPNFLTVTVGDEGLERLDFEILGLP